MAASYGIFIEVSWYTLVDQSQDTFLLSSLLTWTRRFKDHCKFTNLAHTLLRDNKRRGALLLIDTKPPLKKRFVFVNDLYCDLIVFSSFCRPVPVMGPLWNAAGMEMTQHVNPRASLSLVLRFSDTMGIHGLAKLIADQAPGAIKEQDIKNFFGNCSRIHSLYISDAWVSVYPQFSVTYSLYDAWWNANSLCHCWTSTSFHLL